MKRYHDLHIETCVKQGRDFIPIDVAQQIKLKEPLYVDGSIRVTVGAAPHRRYAMDRHHPLVGPHEQNSP